VLAGREITFSANFLLEPGWHIYGAPLPDTYTTTSITFDDPKVIRQSFELPAAEPMEMPALGETLPVFSGSFQALGSLLLKFPIDAGQTVLSGQLRFQQCSDTVCEPPQTIAFELPLTMEQFMDAERKK
jgi:thioredoxin:protein disulfide reductase